MENKFYCSKNIQFDSEGEFKKLDRLNRIALEASKQSKRSIIPKVKEVINFEEAMLELKEMDLVLVPY